MNDEIKEWQTQSVKHKVAYVLMMDGISFRYTRLVQAGRTGETYP